MSVTIDHIPIVLNGEEQQIDSGMPLTALLRTLGKDPETVKGVAVAVNDEVVRRQRWADTILQEGDRVEIVTATQGG